MRGRGFRGRRALGFCPRCRRVHLSADCVRSPPHPCRYKWQCRNAVGGLCANTTGADAPAMDRAVLALAANRLAPGDYTFTLT
eukprot:4805405-Pyramimonas_sp.AAC.2